MVTVVTVAKGMMMLSRFIRHMRCAYWQARRTFPKQALVQIADAVTRAEHGHLGEICFVVEASLTPLQLFKGVSARERAIELFSQLQVWDTTHNSGVLVYLLLGEHAVEIVADRGLQPRGDACWPQAAARIREAFVAGDPAAGCIDAVGRIGDFLRAEFPADGSNPDELPDTVRLI